MLEEKNDPRTYKIIGAAMEVHKVLGNGFLEAVYQEALAVEFGLRGIPYKKEVDIPIYYKGNRLDTSYRADFICYEIAVIVEIKAISSLTKRERAQIINYLNATNIEVGLLFNFGSQSLEFERFVNTNKKH